MGIKSEIRKSAQKFLEKMSSVKNPVKNQATLTILLLIRMFFSSSNFWCNCDHRWRHALKCRVSSSDNRRSDNYRVDAFRQQEEGRSCESTAEQPLGRWERRTDRKAASALEPRRISASELELMTRPCIIVPLGSSAVPSRALRQRLRGDSAKTHARSMNRTDKTDVDDARERRRARALNASLH